MGEKRVMNGRTTKVARNHSLSIMKRLIISIAYWAIRRYPPSLPFYLGSCWICYVCALGRAGRSGGGVGVSIGERRRSRSISENGGCAGDEEWDGC